MQRTLSCIIIFLSFCFPSHLVKAEGVFSWDDCLSEAKKNNPELISAAEGISQEKAAETITKSGLFPQVSGSLGASTAKTSTSTSSSTADSYSYGLSGSQLIFDGLKTANDLKAATENIKVAQQNYRFTSSEVRLSLRTAFVNLLKAQELIKVAEEIVKIRRDNWVLIALRYQSGLEHKGALLTAEANLAEANLELSQAKRDVELAQRQLTKEMGRKEFKPLEVKGDFALRENTNAKPNFEDLLKNNPGVLEAVFKKNSALYGVKSAHANFAPELSGIASASQKSSDWPPGDDQWNLGLSLNLPIFEGGLKNAQLNQAKAAYNKAEADERSIRDTAVVSLEQTWVALQDAMETIEVQLKTLKASQERSKIAESQYSNGFINFDNWIIIENDLVTAKKSYLEAQANSLLAEANWVQAKGETLEYAQ